EVFDGLRMFDEQLLGALEGEDGHEADEGRGEESAEDHLAAEMRGGEAGGDGGEPGGGDALGGERTGRGDPAVPKDPERADGREETGDEQDAAAGEGFAKESQAGAEEHGR